MVYTLLRVGLQGALIAPIGEFSTLEDARKKMLDCMAAYPRRYYRIEDEQGNRFLEREEPDYTSGMDELQHERTTAARIDELEKLREEMLKSLEYIDEGEHSACSYGQSLILHRYVERTNDRIKELKGE